MSRARWVASALVGMAAALCGDAAAHAEGAVWGSEWAVGRSTPLAFGVGLTVYEQRQGYDLERLSVGLPGFDLLPTGGLEIENRIREANVKLDAWILPFLNVFLMGGQLDGRTLVDFSSLPLPFPLGRVPIDYDGEVFGAGATLTAGTDLGFGSLTAVWTRTSLGGDFDSEAEALVVSPRFGLHDEARGAIWLGAMFQRAEESHRGTIALPFVGRVPFAVELAEQEAWNGLVGGTVSFDESWHLELEGGFGERTSATATVTWRF